MLGVLLTSPSAQEPEQPSLRISTTTILFDVVVRDDKGTPVVDLDIADFELSEDGQRQTLSALLGPGGRPLSDARSPRAPVAPAPNATAASETDRDPIAVSAPHDAPSAIAFVFDQLTPESRAMAGRVADALLAAMPSGHFVGLFGLERALHVAQEFTTDREAARSALARLVQRPIVVRDGSGTISPRTGVDLSPRVSPTVGAESAGGLPTFEDRERMRRSSDPAAALLYAMEMRMAESYERLTRDTQGQQAAVGLRAVAAGMAGVRGRKAVVLFSEGIPLSDQARQLFDTLVATANRAGVTFYTVDAAGLRAHSTLAAASREQQLAGRVALGDEGRSQGAWTRDLEDQADLVRSDGTASLARLSRETGGVLLENTNSVERIAGRIADDQAAHYLLAYTPEKSEMDGTYRRVAVKVTRKHVTVTHRSGYWAVPAQ